MLTSAQDILDAFQRLTQEEQRVVVAAILRGTGDSECPPLNEEALALIADETFQEYDARESAENEG